MRNYRIYPSLMDAYEWMMAQEDEESFLKAKSDLLDKLNRRPTPTSEAASRGTALNCIVDNIVGNVVSKYSEGTDYYEREQDGFTFRFGKNFVHSIADYVQDSLCQPYGEASILTDHGYVTLYGFADYLRIDTIIDLKTTGNYTAGKFRNHWQHRVYPYIFESGGYAERITDFCYLVAEVRECGGVICGELYPETYTVSLPQCAEEIRQGLDSGLLAFIDDYLSEIDNERLLPK